MAGRPAPSIYRQIAWICGAVMISVVIAFCAMTFLLPRAPAAKPFDPIAAHKEWIAEIQSVATEVDQHPTTERLHELREHLLLARVTAEDRDAHLKFLLALMALERGDEGAEQTFDAARHAALATP